MDEIAASREEATDHTAAVSLAGSSELARQIRQGAPADVCVSADTEWMDALRADGPIDPETRFDLLTDSIVPIAHGAEAPPVEIAPGFGLAGTLGEERFTMAKVDAVPAGI